MKNIIFLSLYILLSIQSYSQIKVTTLMNILKMNYDQFEGFSIKNGWELDEIENTDYIKGITYKKGDKTNKEFLTLYKKFYVRNNFVSFQTSNKERYIYLNNELRSIGFKLIKTEIKENREKSIYRKKMNNNLTFELMIYQFTTNYKGLLDGWEFDLSQI